MEFSEIADEISEITQRGEIGKNARTSLFFHVSMWWRIFYGTIRVSLSFVLFKLVGTPFTDVLAMVMNHETSEDSKIAVAVNVTCFHELIQRSHHEQ